MKSRRAAGLRDRMAGDRALHAVVTNLLDRCDRTGALPSAMRYRCGDPEEREALVGLFSAGAVRAVKGDPEAVTLDLEKADAGLREDGGPPLRDLLYEAAGRTPRNIKGEKAALAARAGECVTALADAAEGAARDFLLDAAARLRQGQGEYFRRARENGIGDLVGELEMAARCLAAAEGNESPIRLANFARRATGSSKGLMAGSSRYNLVADMLLRFVPGLAGKIEAESPAGHGERRRLAFEYRGIFRNETPVDVLCFGSFVLEKSGRLLEAPAAHHALGEPVRLLLLHLREARIARVDAERVVSIENETSFNDYVDRVRESGSAEVVLCTQGQANWAVVRLLRLLAEAAPAVPLFHWGDLDRSGILILRSLRRRTGLPIRPLWMDVAMFRRFEAEGQPLPPGEREEIESLLARGEDDECRALLEVIRDSGCWIEQEAVAEGVLADPAP